MSSATFKVGELAKRTELTVRTLHHYDEISLLRPSLRSDAGHRLYSAGDVAQLQQIVSLRQLGFSLEEIRDCLERAGFSPLEVIRLHVLRLREQIEQERAVRAFGSARVPIRIGGRGVRRRLFENNRGDEHDRATLHT